MTNIRTYYWTSFWSSSFLFHIPAFCFLVILFNATFQSSSRPSEWPLSRFFPTNILYAFLCHFRHLPILLLPHSFEYLNWHVWSFLYNILHFQILFFLGPNTFLSILFCTLCSAFKIRNPTLKPWIYKPCSINYHPGIGLSLSFWDLCFFCEWVKYCTMDVYSCRMFCPHPLASFTGSHECLELLIYILNLQSFPLLFPNISCVSY